MAKIERVEVCHGGPQAQGEADRCDPGLHQPGDADRAHLRRRRRGRHRLQLYDRHRRPRGGRADRAQPRAAADRPRSRPRSRRSGSALFFHTHATAVGAITVAGALPRSTPRCGTCAAAAPAGRSMSRPAARRTRCRSTRPKAAGCISRRRSWSRTRSGPRRAGFGGSKIKIGRPPKEDVARLAAVREAVGDDFEIMVDGNQGAAVDEAIRRARLYEPLDLAWYEEPLPAEDLGGHIRLSAATTLPIAVGELIYSLQHFREYLQREAASIVQVDVARIGGITPWLKTAHLAEAFNIAVCPHFLMELHVVADRRGPERPLGRIHPAARQPDHRRDAHRERPRRAVRRARPRHRLGFGGDRPP